MGNSIEVKCSSSILEEDWFGAKGVEEREVLLWYYFDGGLRKLLFSSLLFLLF